MNPRLARIVVYPIKSLDGVTLEAVNVLPSGALENDRRWMMLDARGQVVNGKRTAMVHRAEARFDLQRELVWLDERGAGRPRAYHLRNDRAAIERRLSELLEQTITLAEDTSTGFPDDGDAPGPTLITTETLNAVASWFDGLSLDQVRNRFRANLEFDGVPAFWEDRLIGEPNHEVPFTIGPVRLAGVNPCQRCVVPTRDAESGETTAAFARIFAKVGLSSPRRRGS
ncbi:MAG: MOSC N-terminal beta barrel domain-containing protein, partial [Planctomycetes bacterium]|nr:MOSC N-terminal beta barrel domain-containing protein [Planctomycetota bacterium]